jgi:membrane-associated phospholipid phosphatase
MAETSTLPDRRSGAQRNLLRELAFVGTGYVVYSQVRGLAGDRVVDAFRNGYSIVTLEQEIGIFKELAIQAWVLPNEILMQFFNVIYFYGLFPLLLPTAAWLFWKRPEVYVLARNAFLISGAIAVTCFLILPTAPPRLIGMGFIDTIQLGFAPDYDSIPGVNHFAAVPSMHVGWNVLTAIAVYLGLEGKSWRWTVLLFPPLMFTATVVTGNHYIVDGVLGAMVAGASLLIARRIQRRNALIEAPVQASALADTEALGTPEAPSP